MASQSRLASRAFMEAFTTGSDLYPSNHASVTGASMAVLAHFFHRDAAYLNGLAEQAGISRIYGGIHYRFDMDAGLALGRRAAALALAADLDLVAPGTKDVTPDRRHHNRDERR